MIKAIKTNKMVLSLFSVCLFSTISDLPLTVPEYVWFNSKLLNLDLSNLIETLKYSLPSTKKGLVLSIGISSPMSFKRKFWVKIYELSLKE